MIGIYAGSWENAQKVARDAGLDRNQWRNIADALSVFLTARGAEIWVQSTARTRRDYFEVMDALRARSCNIKHLDD